MLCLGVGFSLPRVRTQMHSDSHMLHLRFGGLILGYCRPLEPSEDVASIQVTHGYCLV